MMFPVQGARFFSGTATLLLPVRIYSLKATYSLFLAMAALITIYMRDGHLLLPPRMATVFQEVIMARDMTSEKYDFTPIGAAIKRARVKRGISREVLSEMCDISVGYIKAIENTGRNPGFQVFWKLVTTFGISVDEYFYPDHEPKMDSKRRNIMGMICEVRADDVYLVESMVKSLTQRGTEDEAE
jgi:transcriptional regulator with XRE-family HTH domain